MKVRHLGIEKTVDPISMTFDHKSRQWYLTALDAGVRKDFLLSEVQPISSLPDPSTTAIAFIVPEHRTDA